MTLHRFCAALTLAGLAGLFGLGQISYGQTVYFGYSSGPPVAAQAAPLLPMDQLEQLLGPIALYPDALVSQILPASTYPGDVASAAAWVRSNPAWVMAAPLPDEALISMQPWEPSVKVLVHYPAVLTMMADSLDWTQALGVAFTYQPQDVMAGIQDLRQQAFAAGNLYSTPEQQVVVIGNNVYILPGDPQELCIPVYDPLVVYGRGRERHPLAFALRYAAGGWLDNDCDWDGRAVIVGGGWHWGWQFQDHKWQRDERRDERRPGDRGIAYRDQRPAVRTWTRNDAKPRPMQPAMATRSAADEHRGWPQRAPAAAPASAPQPSAATSRSRNPAPAVAPAPAAQPPTATPRARVPASVAPAPTAQPQRSQPQPGNPPAQPQPTGNVMGNYQSHVEAQQAADRGRSSRTPATTAPATRTAAPPSAPPAPKAAPAAPRAAPAAPPPAPTARSAPPAAPHAAPAAPPAREAPRAREPTPAPAPRAAPPSPAFTPSSGKDAQAESERGHNSKGH